MKNQYTDSFGNKCWHNDEGDFHREDGPAVELANGVKWWYHNGKCIGRSDYGFTQESFDRYLRSLKIKEYW